MIPQEELEKAYWKMPNLQNRGRFSSKQEIEIFIAGARYAEEHYLNEMKHAGWERSEID